MIVNNTNSIIYETCIDESLTFFNEEFTLNPIELIKKAFKWIIDKIDKAIKFIKNKLKKNKKEEESPKDNKTYALEKPFRKPRSNKTKDIDIDGPIRAGSGRLGLEKPFRKPRSNKTKDIDIDGPIRAGSGRLGLEKPFRKPRSNKTKDIDIDGPLTTPNNNRLALDSKTYRRPRSNKTKEINIDGSIALGDNSRPFVKVPNSLVKKCVIYLNADAISKKFFKKIDDLISKLKSGSYNMENLDSMFSLQSYDIRDLKDYLENISNSSFKMNTTIGNLGFKKRVVFRYINSDKSDIMFIYNPNVDILKTTTDFRNNIKRYESKMIDIVKNLENTKENKSKISDINKIMNEFKKSCTFFISQLTKVADFNIDYELNKILPKGV